MYLAQEEVVETSVRPAGSFERTYPMMRTKPRVVSLVFDSPGKDYRMPSFAQSSESSVGSGESLHSVKSSLSRTFIPRCPSGVGQMNASI